MEEVDSSASVDSKRRCVFFVFFFVFFPRFRVFRLEQGVGVSRLSETQSSASVLPCFDYSSKTNRMLSKIACTRPQLKHRDSASTKSPKSHVTSAIRIMFATVARQITKQDSITDIKQTSKRAEDSDREMV